MKLKYDAASTYERIAANCGEEHGLSEHEFEAHKRAITQLVLSVRGQLLPEMKK